MSLMRNEPRSAWPLDFVWSEEGVDRMFRDMFRNFFSGEGLVERFFEARPSLIRVEEYVEDDTCVIRVELPGVDPDKDVETMIKRKYWLCLRHHAVEGEQGCRSADRLGPYDTAEDAAQALERARERTEAWQHDPRCKDDGDA